MEKIKNNKLKLFIILIIITFLIILFCYFSSNNDGMEQTKGISIYYRTYTKEDGWGKWVKNGVTSGSTNKKSNIKNIQIKVRTFTKGSISYQIYDSKNGWTDDLYYNEKIKNRKISGIRFAPDGLINTKYDVFYRTYIDGKGWLDWAYEGMPSGVVNTGINAIQIKVIPKNVIENKYLKDYNSNNNSINIGF